LQLFKDQRAHLANKTVNNILSHLRTMLTSAVEWGLLERMPVEVKRLKGAHRRAVRVEGSRHAAQARQDPRGADDREARPSAPRWTAPSGPAGVRLDNEKPLGQRTLRDWLAKACTQAELEVQSPHSLRHTFCSHLAMRGAPTRAIQELAGHSDLKTTQRYMHLTPAALESAIGLLEQPAPVIRLAAQQSRDKLETV
jgi:hypothetical protein